MESMQASGLNSASEILKPSARTPLQFSKQGPVIRILPHSVELHLSWGLVSSTFEGMHRSWKKILRFIPGS
jgi:hypothetical protein